MATSPPLSPSPPARPARARRFWKPAPERLEDRRLLAGGFTEFRGPFQDPSQVINGPGGELWVLDGGGSRVDLVGTDGTVRAQYPVPGATRMTLGPDGDVWFTEFASGKVGKITPAGAVTDYAVPSRAVSFPFVSGPTDTPAGPTGITAGPDGALWFTEATSNGIGRITTDGRITEFPVDNAAPGGIAAGTDGALWFTVASATQGVGRITTDGRVTLSPRHAGLVSGSDVSAAPDGSVWFGDGYEPDVARIAPDGTLSVLSLRKTGDSPVSGTIGPDGNYWLTTAGNDLDRVTPQGVVTSYPIPGTQGGGGASPLATGLTAGPDGALWFAEGRGNALVRVDPLGLPDPSATNPLSGVPGDFSMGPGSGPASLQGQAALFDDANPSAAPADFTATIEWGDGTASGGTVVTADNGSFAVTGSHSYAASGTYPVTVTVTEVNPSQTPARASLTLTSRQATAPPGWGQGSSDHLATGTTSTGTASRPSAHAGDGVSLVSLAPSRLVAGPPPAPPAAGPGPVVAGPLALDARASFTAGALSAFRTVHARARAGAHGQAPTRVAATATGAHLQARPSTPRLRPTTHRPGDSAREGLRGLHAREVPKGAP